MHRPVRVAVSGGFDPFHVGHLNHFQTARKLGDHLTVILNSDRFLLDKKGYVFMPFSERKQILQELKCVDIVVDSVDIDQTVARTLEQIHPDIFAKGGDRTIDNVPREEIDTCRRLGIKLVCGAGGDRVHSSRGIVEKCLKH